MTQFALVRVCDGAEERISRHLKDCPDVGLIANAALALFGRDSGVYELAPNGCQFEEVYLAAQRQVADGGDVSSTEMMDLLGRISADIAEIALWYGDDFRDLPTVSSWEEFSGAVARDITMSALETYLHYQR